MYAIRSYYAARLEVFLRHQRVVVAYSRNRVVDDGLGAGRGGLHDDRVQEVLRRLVGSLPKGTGTDTSLLVRRALEIIGMAKVATSADEAMEIGFLTPADGVSLV